MFLFSFSNSNSNENWDGFDTSFESSTQNYQGSLSEPQNTSTTGNTSIKRQHKNEKIDKVEKSDFSALDVKASKPKSTNKTKSIEEDAWNLLNN